jgi:hypothetical protein
MRTDAWAADATAGGSECGSESGSEGGVANRDVFLSTRRRGF